MDDLKSMILVVLMISGGMGQNVSTNSQYSCYDGFGSNAVIKTGCQVCQTTSTWTSGSIQSSTYLCGSSCSQSNVTSGASSVVTSCCYGNNCNNPSTSSGVKCIDSDGSIKGGCKYCQKIVNTFPTQATLSRSCTSTCIAIDVGIVKTICCQTDMCNFAVQKVPSISIYLAGILLLFALF